MKLETINSIDLNNQLNGMHCMTPIQLIDTHGYRTVGYFDNRPDEGRVYLYQSINPDGSGIVTSDMLYVDYAAINSILPFYNPIPEGLPQDG